MAALFARWMFRRSARGFLVCAALLLFGAPLTVSSSASVNTVKTGARTCEELKRWALVYRDASPTLEQLAEWDRPRRVAIFNAIRPQVRSILWQEQLRRLGQRRDLSSTQRALVIEGAALMTPALYEHDAAATSALKSFWARASAQFTSVEFKRAWFDLGAVDTIAANRLGKSISNRRGDRPVSNIHEVSCECSVPWQDCLASGCTYTSCHQSQGCGPGGSLVCDGTCQ